jgi:hypothetical protein
VRSAGVAHQRVHRGLLVDAHARGGGRLRQAQRVLQRVQMARAGVEHAAVETRAGDPGPDVLVPDTLQRITVDGFDAPGPGRQFTPLARCRGQAQVAVLPVAGDAVLGDALAQQVQRFYRHRPDALRFVQAQLRLDGGLVAGQPVDGLAAVAAAGAEADLAPFQHGDAQAAAAQVDGGTQARQAAAHHGHVAFRISRQRREGLASHGRGGVVRVPGEFQVGVEQGHEAVR